MILIRHGESTWNQERRVQGNLDPGLSDRGRAQAALLAARLNGRRFCGLYTSPLRRALETAEALGKSLGLRPQPVDGLREIRLGAWEGKTTAEIRGTHGDEYDRWLDRPLDASAPLGGEGVRAFQLRAVTALESLRAVHHNGDFIVVTHGGVIKAYVCQILGLDLNRMFRLRVDNTAVTEILFNRETASLILLNDTCHLNGDKIARPPMGAISDGEQAAAPFVF